MSHPTDPGTSRLEVHTTPDRAGRTLVASAELQAGRWRIAHRDGRTVTVTSRMEVVERLLAVCAHTSSCAGCGDTIEYVMDSGEWRHCFPPEREHHPFPAEVQS